MIKITQKEKLLDSANHVFSGTIEHHFAVYFSNLEVVMQYLYSYSSSNRYGVFSELLSALKIRFKFVVPALFLFLFL